MSTQPVQLEEDLKLFEYALEDFLEIEGPVPAGSMHSLKEYFHAQGLDHFDLFSVKGFRVGPYIVLLDQASLGPAQTLVLFGSKNGKLTALPLHSRRYSPR